ncbi:hypothetical protein BSG01_017 [Bacillus phage BSG01]|nr:hypothetical protein BSG01_017 [Bacillus phage BSG01]
MFARINFEENQHITKDELKTIEEVICDTVKTEELIEVVETGKVKSFASWDHTYDKEEAKEGNKHLVVKSEMVKLETYQEYIVELTSFLIKFPNLKIKLRGTMQTNDTQLSNMMDFMNAAVEKFNNALKNFNEKVEFNQRCDVHIGNLGLLNINQLAYTTDKCTEELQNILDEGWRILAVCPQPDQRRPDYVLGRYNENYNANYAGCLYL